MNVETLYQIHQTLEHHLELESLCEAILQLLPDFGADFGSILVQEESDTLYFYSTIPGRDDLTGPAGRRLAHRLVTEGLTGQVLRRDKPELVKDLATDPRAYQAGYLMKSCRGAILLPIQMVKAQARGVLLFGSGRENAFSEDDLASFEIIAWQISHEIENTLLYRNQVERAAQLALINEVNRAATSILNVELVLATVTQAVQRSFGFHRVSVYLSSSDEEGLRLRVFTGANGRTLQPQASLTDNKSLINWVAERREIVVINDVKLDQRYVARSDGEQVKSTLIIPIRLGIKTIGVLDLESTDMDAFSSPLVAALETLTDQLAVAVENARLYDEISDRLNEIHSLLNISQAVSSSLDLQETLTLITEHVTTMLKVDATSVALRDDHTDEVWFAAAFGAGSEEVLGMRIPLGKGVAGWVAEKGESIIVPDVHSDTRFYPDIDKQSGFHTQSILCVPLETKGRLIGAIEAINKIDGSQFTQQDLQQLASLTAPAATAIENAQLYEELAYKIEQLEETQAQLIQSAKLSAIGELAAGVAHEINNPLTSIIGLSKILYDDLNGQGEMGEDLGIIQDEANRAKNIVRALLDFARVGRPVRSPADLNRVLEEAIFLALPEKVRHNVEIIKNLESIPKASIDENQIKQVIINIVNNAVQAMPAGGQLTISSQMAANYEQAISLSFSDTGGGIPPEYADKIFDPFFTTKETGKGTGLGLSVSYGIIDRHNGKIEVENKPGQGTTFHIILPIISYTDPEPQDSAASYDSDVDALEPYIAI